jgi:hypothetical protein
MGHQIAQREKYELINLHEFVPQDGFVAQIRPPSTLAAGRVGCSHETHSSEVPNDELESI